MDGINLDKMSKAEKVELLEAIAAGDLVVIDGQVFDKNAGSVLIEKDGKFYHDAECTAECTTEQRKHLKAVMILPFNQRQ